MSLIVKGNDKEQPGVGTHLAVCAFVEDIGVQETMFGLKRQIIICWELEKLMEKGENRGKPFMLSKWYSFSLNERSNLAKDLESWFGFKFTEKQRHEGFDLERLIGKICMIGVIEREDGRQTIGSIIKPPDGCKELTVYNKKPPEWIHSARMKSLEYRDQNQDNSPGAEEKDLPF